MEQSTQVNGQSPHDQLPEGWMAGWSQQYGERFYVNVHSGQSQWEAPTQAAPRVPTDNPPPFENSDYSDKIALKSEVKPQYINTREVSSTTNGTSTNQNEKSESELLSDFEFDGDVSSSVSAPVLNGWSRKNSCRVMVKRFTKNDQDDLARADREISALGSLSDPAVPPLLEVFDSSLARFIVLENRKDEPLKKYIEGRGTLSDDLLKAVTTQMFAALATIFMAGLTHLRICDETLFLDATGQLTIKDFHYAHQYGKEVNPPQYALVEVKYGSDLYVAPEVTAATSYNGRKATLWSCGVAIYFMTTGQLEKLSTIEHPLNNNMQAPSSTTASPRGSISEGLHQRRRSSLSGRKLSLSSSAQALTPIPYPGSTRFEVPSYARDIISKLLITNPLKRAELLEVATKVPKEIAMKATRPLVELAWLDYKTHVGPNAGLEDTPELASSSSSMFSGTSNFSNPFGGLLSGRRRSSIKGAMGYASEVR